MATYHHILLATDLADSSANVADTAAKFAELFGAQLSLIHVIEPLPAYGYPGVTELESPFIEEAQKAIAELGKKLNIPKGEQRVEFGSVKTQVLNIASELNVDLIIIGSHGRHGFSRLLGSSASGVVHGAGCDVFVVRCADAK